MNGNAVRRGMRVYAGDTEGFWYVLDRHPEQGHWWLHRRNSDGEWQTTYEHYKNLNQVRVKVC